jgi:hypothetical protein
LTGPLLTNRTKSEETNNTHIYKTLLTFINKTLNIMKKIFFGMMAIVAMVATSCQQELAFGAKGNDTATVSFAVGTPSRAYSDGCTRPNF